MSLINEALKRAKHCQARQPLRPAAGPPLQPVVHRASGRRGFPWALPAVACTLLIAGAWLLFVSWRQSQTVAQSLVPTAQAAGESRFQLVPQTMPSSPNVTEAIAASNAPPATVQPDEVARSPRIETAEAAESVTQEVVAAPGPDLQANPLTDSTAATPTDRPDFRLQGIFYRASNASALIDGHTMFVGDEIEGAKLVLIERHSVRLLKGGTPIVLKLR